jgi:hypothetical protein
MFISIKCCGARYYQARRHAAAAYVYDVRLLVLRVVGVHAAEHAIEIATATTCDCEKRARMLGNAEDVIECI